MPSIRLRRGALTLAVIAFVCAGATGAAVAVEAPTPGSGHQSATAGCIPTTAPVEGDEAVGDIVEIEVVLCSGSSVTIEGPSYRGTVSLSRENKSGPVTIRLNTYLNGSDAVDVRSDTLESVRTNASGTGSFEPGNYTVVVRDGGEVIDETTFELQTPQARDLHLWRAPRGAADDLRTVDSIESSRKTVARVDARRRIEEPNYDDSLKVATNETVVVAVKADGLDGVMAAATGSPLERFRTALQERGASFRVEQTRETVRPENRPLTPNVLNSSATHLVPHPENDTYYVVIDTQRLWGQREGSRDSPVHLGSREIGFVYRFSMHEGDVDTDPPADLVSADYEVVERSFAFPRVQKEPVVLTPQVDAQLLVRTTLAPGSKVTVNVSGGVNRTTTRTVRVRNDSGAPSFVVPLDLSTEPNGTRFMVRFRKGTPIGRFEDPLRGAVRTPRASLEVGDDPVSDLSLVVDSLHVTHQSIVAVHAQNGTLLSSTAVDSGTTRSLSVPLTSTPSDPSTYRVVVYRDADRSGSLTDADERYRVAGVPVAATVAAESTETESSTETATATETASVTTSAATDTATSTTEASTPGFGVVPSLIALVGTVVVRRRIRR